MILRASDACYDVHSRETFNPACSSSRISSAASVVGISIILAPRMRRASRAPRAAQALPARRHARLPGEHGGQHPEERHARVHRADGMNRARTWSALPSAAALIAAGVAAACAEADEPGSSRWPIKTAISVAADLNHPRDVPLASLLELGTVPGVKGNDRRYQAQRIPAEAFGNPLGLKEGDIVRTTGWLHVIARKPDGDYHVQIAVNQTNQAQCLIVEVPNPDPRFKVPAGLQPIVAAVRGEIEKHLEPAFAG